MPARRFWQNARTTEVCATVQVFLLALLLSDNTRVVENQRATANQAQQSRSKSQMNGMLLHLPAGASTVARAPVPPLPRQLAPRRTARCSAKKKAANEAKDDRRAGDGAGVLSRTVMLRAGVALFALGFVDAG